MGKNTIIELIRSSKGDEEKKEELENFYCIANDMLDKKYIQGRQMALAKTKFDEFIMWAIQAMQ
jgi:hypothetical protein